MRRAPSSPTAGHRICGRGAHTSAALADADVGRVVLELTEHRSVSDHPGLSEALAPWRAKGLKLAIDDARAGFASLAA